MLVESSVALQPEPMFLTNLGLDTFEFEGIRPPPSAASDKGRRPEFKGAVGPLS